MPPASNPGEQQVDGDVVPLRPRAGVLDLVLPAEWITPALVRSRVREWLGWRPWPAGLVNELVLAVSEAVSNSVEHGYGIAADDHDDRAHVIEVAGRVEPDADHTSRIVLVVRDRGRWRAPTVDPTAIRGHGITIMRSCVDELTVDHDGDAGTTVTMRSRPVPVVTRADGAR